MALEPQCLRKELLEIPWGEQIVKCIQCGTCTGSCPMAPVMDYGPRQLFALAREGDFREVFGANTYWVCTSCYLCTVRCPRGIKITDFMYGLKRMSAIHGYTLSKGKAFHMHLAFKKTVEKYGRLQEARMVQRYFLKEPSDILKNASLGVKLFLKGRISLNVKPLKNLSVFRKVIDKAKQLEGKK